MNTSAYAYTWTFPCLFLVGEAKYPELMIRSVHVFFFRYLAVFYFPKHETLALQEIANAKMFCVMEKDSKVSRQASLDVLKCFAAFLVVDIHAGFPGKPGSYITAIARIAVPLFFMITGYFYPIMVSKGRIKNYVRKLIQLTLITSLFFLSIIIVRGLLKGTFLEQMDILFNIKSLLKWGLLNNCPLGGHLWYFYAILYVLVLMGLADCLNLRSWLYRFIPLLLIINYLLSFGSHITLYRNFLFTGLPYVLLGSFLQEKSSIINHRFPSDKQVVYGLIICGFLLGVEMIVYKFTGLQQPRDHYLFTFPLVVGLFVLALRNPSFGAGSKLACIGKRYSPYIYMFHPFIIMCLAHFPLFSNWIIYCNFRPVIIFLFTLVCVYAGCKLVEWYKTNVCK